MYFRFLDATTLQVTCPFLMTNSFVISSINKNMKALSKMQKRAEENSESDEYFCFQGKRYIRVFDESLSKVTFDQDFVYAKDEKFLDRFIKKYTKEYFELEVNYIKEYFHDIPEFKLRIRKMKTRWGVCNKSSMSVTLNTLLIHKRVDLIDYVICHELSHFDHMDHSKAFWEEVGKHFKDYKAARKELNS
jgi:predicted metal-dependent hydrolase